MDELQISGKRFISSRRLARDNGYTADYLGQLIRGGKIVGQKVGRAWYVEANSFETYLGGEATISSIPVLAAVVEEEVVEAPIAMPEVAEDIAAPIEEEVVEEISEEIVPVVIQEEEAEEPVEEIKEVKEVKVIETPIVVIEKEEEQTFRVPLHIIKKEEVVEEKNVGGLRYYADNEPSLPEIRSNKKESRVTDHLEVEDAETGKPAVAARAPQASNFRVLVLAGAGLAIFVFSALVSSAMSVNLSIEAGNTASTSYSLSW